MQMMPPYMDDKIEWALGVRTIVRSKSYGPQDAIEPSLFKDKKLMMNIKQFKIETAPHSKNIKDYEPKHYNELDQIKPVLGAVEDFLQLTVIMTKQQETFQNVEEEKCAQKEGDKMKITKQHVISMSSRTKIIKSNKEDKQVLSYSYRDELGLLITKEVIRIVSPIKPESQVSQIDNDDDHDLNICVPQIKINSQLEKLNLVKKTKRIFT